MPADGPAEERRKTPRTRPVKPLPTDVTAVLVSHDGVAWLPEAIGALASSTRTPAQVVCVDTGSLDGSAALLEGAYGQVLRLPRDTGFGAAVAAGLGQAPRTGWVWLLHDDCAVEPTTLQALLEHAELSPSAALLGPKARDWNDPRVLVEVGVTTDAAGHRETGLERREYDQGQHDVVRDVLAVGTAGALVRREVWDAVGGLDPQLPVFRDDLDLGWKVNAAGHRVVVVPEARIRHARAATTGRRETDAAPGRATGTDRKNALYVLLAHAGLLHLIGLVPRLLLATAARALGLLLTRQVADAADEVRALASVFGRPGRLLAGRRARAATRTVSTRQLRPLFASRTVRIRARAGALGDWLSGGSAPGTNPLGALGDPGPEGPDDLDLSARGSGTLRRLLVRPGVLLVLGLSAVALVAERSVLRLGGGVLAGGMLLPSPAGARDLWAAYVGAWHRTSVGSGTAAPPGTAALAALSSVLLGKPSLAVDVLLLASVPMAGLTAYVAASRLVRHLYLRIWAAATWALLPVATGAVAAGRLDAAAVQIGLPLLVVAGGRLLHDDPRLEGWWRAWAVGLGLAATAAFAPLLWPLSAAVLLAGAAVNLATGDGGPRRAVAAVIAVAVPLAVLFPWSLDALRRPSLFVAGSQLADPDLPAWHLLLLSPGGPGLPPVLVTAGVVLAALGGTVRRDFRRLAEGAWGGALVGLLAAGLLSRARVDGMPVWPGIALQLSAVALLVAALVAANGVRSRLARSSFGARQLFAGLVAVAAVAAPVLAAGAWVVRGADDPLRRDLRPLLPAFARAELAGSPGLRVLALDSEGGRLAYDLTDGDGTRLDDAGTSPGDAQLRALDAVVADLASPRGSDAAEALSTRAVRYVALRGAAGAGDVAAALDAQAGLVRRTSGQVVVWQVLAPSARLSVLPPEAADSARSGDRAPTAELLRTSRPIALPSGREGASTAVPAGANGRLLVLAEASDPGWRARLDGKPLTRRTAWGWAQAFELPAGGGRLELDHAQAGRQAALGLQVVLLLIVVVLSVPGGRRRRGLEDDLDDVQDGDERPAGERLAPVVAAVSSSRAQSSRAQSSRPESSREAASQDHSGARASGNDTTDDTTDDLTDDLTDSDLTDSDMTDSDMTDSDTVEGGSDRAGGDRAKVRVIKVVP